MMVRETKVCGLSIHQSSIHLPIHPFLPHPLALACRPFQVEVKVIEVTTAPSFRLFVAMDASDTEATSSDRMLNSCSEGGEVDGEFESPEF